MSKPRMPRLVLMPELELLEVTPRELELTFELCVLSSCLIYMSALVVRALIDFEPRISNRGTSALMVVVNHFLNSTATIESSP